MPLRAILGTYYGAAKKYPVSGVLTFVLYGASLLAGGVLTKLVYRNIFDAIVGATADRSALWPQLAMSLLVLAVLVILSNACSRGADFFITYAQSHTIRDLENFATQALLKHSYAFFTGNFTGGLVTRVRRFSRSFETLHDQLVYVFWFAGTQLIGILVVLAFTMPPLAVFFALWCIAYILVSYVFERYHLPYDLKLAASDSATTGQLSDIITNILNIKMFAARKREMERFHGYTDELCRSRQISWNIYNGFHAFQGLAMAILEVVGMFMAVRLWMAGTISAGTVVLAQFYFLLVIGQTWSIGRGLRDTFRALADAEEMVAILRKPLEVSDPPSPEPSRIRHGRILLDHLSFHYEKGIDVFTDFTLSIPAGQKVGVVGHSGSGKSTLFKLLLHFLNVSQGSITIDGQDIRAITQDDLRRAISYVPQEPILFHRSLLENIAYAKPDATKDEVIAAAKRAHAHDFIERLPQGYDTFVGERGIKLSGGERQRVAIARVILKNAPILLLDEATSSLDSLSEKYIQEQLLALMEERTTLAIAHRISTLTHMDRIIVLGGGSILEDGSHASLLAKGGLYAELWRHQSHGFLMAEESSKPPDDASNEDQMALEL